MLRSTPIVSHLLISGRSPLHLLPAPGTWGRVLALPSARSKRAAPPAVPAPGSAQCPLQAAPPAVPAPLLPCPAPLGCAHTRITPQMDTEEIQLTVFALLPCSSPKKTQKVNPVHLWASQVLVSAESCGEHEADVLGVISTDNVPLKQPPSLPSEKTESAILFPKYGLICLPTVLFSSFLGLPPIRTLVISCSPHLEHRVGRDVAISHLIKV